MAYNIDTAFRSGVQPAFSSNLSAPAANATGDGTVVTVVFDNATINQGSNYNTGTGIFTAPVTGVYVFTCSIMFNGPAAGYGQVQFVGNAYIQYVNQVPAEATSGNTVVCASAVIKMTAADTMKIQASWNGIAKIVGLYGGAISTGFFCSFAGYQLC